MKPILPLFFLLAACSGGGGSTSNDGAIYASEEVSRPLSPGIQPVRIGEGGPDFAACGTLGRVVNLSPEGETYLPLRAAPFLEADETARLAIDQRLYVCTRSIDQRWLGVVVPLAGAGQADCGVSAPAASPRGYSGSCRSGWVSSGFVRLVGQ